MKKRRKTGIWIAVCLTVALIAAPFVYGMLQLDHFPCEPPIKEQVEAQYGALISSADIPLPIPLVIGDTELREFSLDALREALLANGFREVTKDNLSEFSADVQARYRSEPLFSSENEKVVVMWHERSLFITNGNMYSIMVCGSQKGMKGSQLNSYFADGSETIVYLPLDILLGSDIADVLKKLKEMDYDYHYSDYAKRKRGISSESITLHRGVYFYMFIYYDGKLSMVSLACTRESADQEISGLSEKDAMKLVDKKFRSNRFAQGKFDNFLRKIYGLFR